MASTSDWDSVILTDGEGAVYRIPLADLAKYQMPPAEAEEMLEGDVVGFSAEPRISGFGLIGFVLCDGSVRLADGSSNTAQGQRVAGYDLKVNKKV